MSPPSTGAVAQRGALGAALLAVGLVAARSPRARVGDARLGAALRAVVGARGDRAVVATTDLGSVYAISGIAGVLALAGRRDEAIDALAVGLLAWGIAQRSKSLLDRRRPYEAEGTRRLLRPPSGSSFPSGHAAVAMAWTTRLGERSPARPVRVGLAALGAAIGLTRVHAGVHYPSDVVAGAGLGLLISAAWRGRLARGLRALASRRAVP